MADSIILLDPVFFSLFPDHWFVGGPDLLKCYCHHIRELVARGIEVPSCWLVFISCDVSPVLSQSLTEPLASFSNVDPFRAFFAGQFIYNIGSLAINVSRYVPFLTCFLALVVGSFLSRSEVRMHAGDTQDVSGALAVSRTEAGRSSF